MLKRGAFLVLSCGLTLAHCTLGGDTGTEGDWPVCGDRGSEMQVAPDAQTLHGSASALAESATLSHDAMLSYRHIEREMSVDETSSLHVSVRADASTARLVEHKDRHDPGRACDPSLELDAVVELESADGAFRERLLGTIALTDQRPGLSASLRFAERRGGYTTEAFVGSKHAILSAQMSLQTGPVLADGGELVTERRWSGSLTLYDPTLKDSTSAAVAEW